MPPILDRSRATPVRAGVVVLLAVAWLALLASGAGAHPAVVTSSPGDGATLEDPPEEVSITFGEGVEAPLGAVKVYDRDSVRVDLDDARLTGPARRTAVVTLRPDLPDGPYVVIWRAIGLGDGHLVIGQQHFVVGGAAAGSVTGPTDGGGDTGWPTVATRVVGAVGTLGTVVAAGVAFFAIAVLRRPGARWRPARLALARAVRIGSAVAVVAAVGSIVAHALERAAAFGTPLTPTVVAATVVGPLGTAALARGLLLLPLATRHLLGVRGYVAVATTLAAGTLAVDGHVDGAGLLAAFVHVLVVASWAGGLVGLLLTVRHAPDDDAVGLATTLGRFSGVAVVTVVVAGAAGGLVATATADAGVEAALASPWGRALSVKTVLAIAALLVAAHTRSVVLPRLRATTAAVPQGASIDVGVGVGDAVTPVGAASATVDATGDRRASAAPPDTLRLLRRNLAIEVGLVAGVVLTSGALSTLAPPTAAADEDCPTPLAAAVAVIAHPCEDDGPA